MFIGSTARSAPRARRVLPALPAVAFLALLLVLPASPKPVGVHSLMDQLPGSSSGPLGYHGAPLGGPAAVPLANDGSRLVLNLTRGGTSSLHDWVTDAGGDVANRSYWLNVTVSIAVPTQGVQLNSSALFEWSRPAQQPEGADVVPPAADWTWRVYEGTKNDTPNWSWIGSASALDRSATWVNSSFLITGRAQSVVHLTIDGSSSTGTTTPAVGFSVNSPFATTNGLADPDLAASAAALRPTIVRIGLAAFTSTVTWNSSGNGPVFDFGPLDKALSFVHNLSSAAYLSVPAGSWGNGNALPSGMPLNTTLPVPAASGLGYFPQPSAYAAYIQAIALHIAASGLFVAYWNIGNEVPLSNASVVAAYVTVFNAAERTIHLALPSTLVGSDVMTDKTYEPYFAQNAHSVGFLAFHYYPADGLCVQNGSYCPPTPGSAGSTDAQILGGGSNYTGQKFAPPRSGQALWHNLTGNWLPSLDAESNLNYAGGAATVSTGTDPRQQMLFGAVWTASVIIAGAAQNLAWFNYFNLQAPLTTPATVTGALGGWGFGMTNEGTADNDLRYAPYWALELWGQNFPAGSTGLTVTPADTGLTRAWAVHNGSALNVLVVNRANVPLVVSLSALHTARAPIVVQFLDGRSYVETFNRSSGVEDLGSSGLTTSYRAAANATSITIVGYGLAVVRFGNGSSSPSPWNPLGAISTTAWVGLILVVGVATAVVAGFVNGRRAIRGVSVAPSPPPSAVEPISEPSPAPAPVSPPFDPTAYDTDQLGRNR